MAGSPTLKHTVHTHQYIPLLIVDTGEVAVDDGVIWTEAQGPEVGSHCPVKYPGLLQHIAEVDVGIQEGGIQLDSLGRERGEMRN